MASEDTHAGIMEFFRRNLGEPSRMLGLKNAVYVEVFGDTMGQRLMRLNNVEWRRREPLRRQVIFARMSLDKIVKYITVGLKLNAKNEAHVQELKHFGGGQPRQPPSFPWHARPQSHEIQDLNSNLGFSKEFCDPCLGHDTIWRPGQGDEGICRQYQHVDK